MSTPKRHNPRKAGRKTKYRKEYADQVLTLIAGGMTQTQVHQFFGVTGQTWANWKRNNPALLENVNHGLTKKSGQVIDALFKSAIGYESIEETVVEESDGTKEKRTKKRVKRNVSPNTASIQYYLNNRIPDKWKRSLEPPVESVIKDDGVHGFRNRIAEMEQQDEGMGLEDG